MIEQFCVQGANTKLSKDELPIEGIIDSDFVYVTSLSQESSARLPDIANIAKKKNVPVALILGLAN